MPVSLAAYGSRSRVTFVGHCRAVVFNQVYSYPRRYAKTSYGVYVKIEM
jgi:hypothetical protein